MTTRDDVVALRSGVVTTTAPGTVALRIEGAHAFEVVDAIVSSDLQLQDAQMRPSLLLREDGSPFADIEICRDDEAFVLLAEGPTAPELADYVRAYAPAGNTFAAHDLGEALTRIAIHGPYAWELLGAWRGLDLVGLPYLTFFRDRGGLVFRSGKTGEYGYDVWLPRATASEELAKLDELGRAFDAREVAVDVIDASMMENGFFDIRREGAWPAVTPIELALQWRVSRRKSYVGAEALAARRALSPEPPRATFVTAADRFDKGDRVVSEGHTLGPVIAANHSHVLDAWIGIALLEREWAHAGLPGLAMVRGHDGANAGEPIAARTVSPPVLRNLSLFVSPQRHAYASRGDDAFPAITGMRAGDTSREDEPR